MENPNSKGSNNFVVGLLVMVTLSVAMAFIVFVGGVNFFHEDHKFKTVFKDARGLNIGAPVFYLGIHVGRVSSKQLPENSSQAGVEVEYTVNSRYERHIRKDATVLLTTQGMLGDKTLVISPGSEEAGPAAPGTFLLEKRDKELSEYLDDGGNLVESLLRVSENLEKITSSLHENAALTGTFEEVQQLSQTLRAELRHTSRKKLDPVLTKLERVLTKIDEGKGTLGALVNDPSLHEDLRILLGGAKRSRLLRFLVREAIAQKEGEGSLD